MTGLSGNLSEGQGQGQGHVSKAKANSATEVLDKMHPNSFFSFNSLILNASLSNGPYMT